MHFGCLLALSSVLALSVTATGLAQHVSNAETDRAAKLAMILGRGVGCDLDTERATAKINVWLDLLFPPDSPRQDIYLDMFNDTVRQYAVQQQSGKSPDSCADVAQAFKTLGW